MRKIYRGAEHVNWKGDDVGYGTLHAWIRNLKPEPENCEGCNQPKVRKLDLANISQNYIRDVSDWEYLCRQCHMLKDGRMKNLMRGNKEKTYCECGKEAVTHGGVCMKKYNCLRRHAQPCSCL